MALSIVEVLAERGDIDPDPLAAAFARRWKADPLRGYGPGAQAILADIADGEHHSIAAARPFGGQGSKGNGAAMRAAPIGAFFADHLGRVIEAAKASAAPTHAHPEGAAGAVAVAVAAAVATNMASGTTRRSKAQILMHAVAATADGATREGLRRALGLGFEVDPALAAVELGAGERVLAEDTVPFALWCASRHLDDYVEALWCTVAGLGDRDTTCAIAGGIVALAGAAIPPEWLRSREPLA
jgi:ADP-ribosylglycohydrolase